MVLDYSLTTKYQIQGISGLDHSLNQKILNAYLLSCKVNQLSLYTLSSYAQRIGSFLKQAKELTPESIRLFLLSLQGGRRPSTIGSYYRALKTFFNWLVVEEIIPKSPMQNIKPPRQPKQLIKPFSQQDIDNLLLLTSDNKFLQVRNRAMILLFWDTGLRLGELSNIQLADIDFNTETIKVMGKGARERLVRMGKTTQKALIKYFLLRNDKHLCLWVSEERRPMTRGGIQCTIKKLCYRAGVIDAKPGPHTFRHTFGTQALRNHADLREVQSLLGHATLSMTLRYVATVNSEDAIISHRRFSPVDNLFK